MTNLISTEIKPLSSDVMFKAVFKKHPKVLQQMICDIIGFDDEVFDFQVSIGEELLPRYYGNRKFITDLTITINKDIKINLEINRYNADGLEPRNIMYFSYLIGDIKIGTKYKDLSKIRAYQINFNDFSNANSNIIGEYAYQDKNAPYRRIDMFEFLNLDIAKCYNLVYNDGNGCVSKAIRWAAILMADDIRMIDKILGDDMLMKRDKEEFLKTIDAINHDEGIIKAWMLEKKYQLEEMDRLGTAERKGIQIGVKQGIQKGIKEGITKGINNVIKNMLNHNMDYETIAMATDMHINEIVKMANSMNS